MFDIGWGEFLVIGVVALVAIGPKELPGVLRSVGQWTGKIRRMASEFQGQFQEAMREAEMADIKKHVDDIGADLNKHASSFTDFDPLRETKTQMESAFDVPPIDLSPPAPASADTPPIDVPPVDQVIEAERLDQVIEAERAGHHPHAGSSEIPTSEAAPLAPDESRAKSGPA